MAFTNTEVKTIIKHVTTRWLSLGRFLDRTLSEFKNDNETKGDGKVN